ncbi:MAG TPA: TetR/AcrR family transcriptional regulator [Polyangiales bacterium]|nr:TetR/AcrR family transcriptional regulator [Polyangiales bacterium]
MPRKRAKQKPAADRRQELIDAALVLMAKQGFASTSVDDIAREARVAKGTVYLYFDSKDALLDAIFEQQSLLPELAPALARMTPDSSVEAVVRALVPVLWAALQPRRLGIELFMREGGMHSERGKLFLQRVLPANEQLAALLRERMPKAKLERLDAFVAVRALLVMLIGLFVQQELLGGRDSHPLDDAALSASIAELFLYGVLGS